MVELWCLIGSIFIPGIIILIISSYYNKYKINNTLAFYESIFSVLISFTWEIIRRNINIGEFKQIEPMIIGIITAIVIHLAGLVKKSRHLE